MTDTVQPYFRAYMNSQGFTDRDALVKRDGNMAAYICWISEQRREFSKEEPGFPFGPAFGSWLAEKYPTPVERAA